MRISDCSSDGCCSDLLVRDLADELAELGDALARRGRLEQVCGTLACHGSVRAGRILNAQEMNALPRQLEATPHSGQCNHGCPTYVEFKLAENEKPCGRRCGGVRSEETRAGTEFGTTCGLRVARTHKKTRTNMRDNHD